MGPLGWQETVFIFVLALLVFGPKKLPELGKTIGKALTEFRRASSDLKATFDREMSSLERESESLKEVTSSYQNDLYNYDHDSSYDYEEGSYGSDSSDSADSTATNPSTVSASAPEGAESTDTPDSGVATAATADEEAGSAAETVLSDSGAPGGEPQSGASGGGEAASETQKVTTG